MPLNIVRNDITNMTVDAIVNAANSSLLGGGGVDGAIHKAAGPKLLEECRTLNGCATGDAKITKGYNLKASYVIHTVGPIWEGGNKNERNLLISCYKRSLELAVENNLTSIAFPLISAGVYGYPVDQAFKIAVDTIGDFLLEHELDAYIVVFDSKALSKASLITPEIKEYIDDNYVATHKSFIRNIFDNRRRQMYEDEVDMSYDDACSMVPSEPQFGSSLKNKSLSAMPAPQYYAPSSSMASSKTLEEALSSLDESFTQSLLRIIDEKGLKDSYVYKRANIDRKLFSKIRSDIHYHPKKNTVLALAVALELTLDETEALLKKAGFAISPSNIGDIIVQYHIENRKFNVNEINMVLFAHDMPILGSA